MRQVFEEEWRHALPQQRVLMAFRAPLAIVVAAVALRLSHNPNTSGAHETSWNGLGIDARAAWRGLTRRPAFTLTAVFTIALGIGAATAMVSVIDATVFRALNVPDANRLLWLWGTFQRSGDTEFLISAAEFTDLRTDVRSFDRVGGWSPGEVLIEPHDERPARTVSAANTVGDIYDLVGAHVQLGRLPNAGDDVRGAGAVGVITDRLWRTEFAADPRVLAMHVTSGPRQIHIIGVLAPNAALPGQYGVVSFAVAQQTRELAIRSALGGGRLEIVRRVLRRNAGVVIAGAFAGSIAAAVAAPLMRALLYHVSPLDPVVLLTAPCALTIIAMLASLPPTGRVARLSLVELLRG